MRTLAYCILIQALALGFTTGARADQPLIVEWLVPWKTSYPRDPWVYEGDVWFVGQRGDYVARFDPGGGEFYDYPLPSGTGPHSVVVDERGAWFAANRAGYVGLLQPRSGEIRRYELPGDGPRDVHTMAFTSEGNLWFTVQAGNRIGHLDTESGNMTVFAVVTPGSRPYGLTVVEDVPWVALFGTNRLAIVVAGDVREFELPREEARPRRIAATGNGMIWYVDYAGGYLGRLDPADASVKEWALPGGENSHPYALATDARDRVWFVETGPVPNRLIGFDPEMEAFTVPTAIPRGGGAVRNMYYDPEEDALWFGTDRNTLGRAELP